MHFPSKIDPSSNFFAILFSAFTAVVIVVAVAKRSLPLYLLSAVIAFVCIYYFIGPIFDTCYRLEKEGLRVKSGFFFNKLFDYGEIVAVDAIQSRKFAPALSKERLRIEFLRPDGPQILQISTIREEEFLKELNLHIQFAKDHPELSTAKR